MEIINLKQFLFNATLHLLIVIFPLYVSFLSKLGSSLFSFHPFFMSLSFGLLMTESVLLFSSHSILRNQKTSYAVYYHWILNITSVLLCSIGFIVIYCNKYLKGSNHFMSYHGLIGAFAVASSILQLAIGFIIKYPRLKPKLLKFNLLKKMHAFSGIVTYLLALLALYLSFYSNWFIKNSFQNVDTFAVCLYGYIIVFLYKKVVKKYIFKK